MDQKSIILIGFMGAGKTTVGEVLAAKLDRPFIDVDAEIENEFDMPVSEIFKQHGEARFRQYEQDKTCELAGQQGVILSLGGGAFLNEAIREACLRDGHVFYLNVSWEAWQERFEELVDTRPLLQTRSLEEVKALYEERQPIYSMCHHPVPINHRTPEDIADDIIQLVEKKQH